jgi:hypothetical protein
MGQVTRRAAVGLVAALILAFGSASQGQTVPASSLASITLDQVSWIAGHWVNDDDGTLSEEVWTTPSGGSMLGMWRYVSDGKVRIYELLAISATPEGLVFRLRHFDPAFVGREDKDRALALKLARFEGRLAAFEGSEYSGQGTVRLTYRAKGEDGLGVTLDKGGKSEEFVFKRR